MLSVSFHRIILPVFTRFHPITLPMFTQPFFSRNFMFMPQVVSSVWKFDAYVSGGLLSQKRAPLSPFPTLEAPLDLSSHFHCVVNKSMFQTTTTFQIISKHIQFQLFRDHNSQHELGLGVLHICRAHNFMVGISIEWYWGGEGWWWYQIVQVCSLADLLSRFPREWPVHHRCFL